MAHELVAGSPNEAIVNMLMDLRPVETDWNKVFDEVRAGKLTRETVSLLLNDRDWKKGHRELTAFLAQWDHYQATTPRVDGVLIKEIDSLKWEPR
jgi:hypothetical protein